MGPKALSPLSLSFSFCAFRVNPIIMSFFCFMPHSKYKLFTPIFLRSSEKKNKYEITVCVCCWIFCSPGGEINITIVPSFFINWFLLVLCAGHTHTEMHGRGRHRKRENIHYSNGHFVSSTYYIPISRGHTATRSHSTVLSSWGLCVLGLCVCVSETKSTSKKKR